MKQPENRLTPKEIAFQKEGDSAEIVEWNRQFGLLIGEYLEAVDCADEGWIGDRVHEVRKVLGGVSLSVCHLPDATKYILIRSKN